MGFYVETGTSLHKTLVLCNDHGGREISYEEAKEIVKDKTRAVIVVLHNGPFDAAGFAFDEKEFDALTGDTRYKRYVEMDRTRVCEMTGYRDD